MVSSTLWTEGSGVLGDRDIIYSVFLSMKYTA